MERRPVGRTGGKVQGSQEGIRAVLKDRRAVVAAPQCPPSVVGARQGQRGRIPRREGSRQLQAVRAVDKSHHVVKPAPQLPSMLAVRQGQVCHASHLESVRQRQVDQNPAAPGETPGSTAPLHLRGRQC